MGHHHHTHHTEFHEEAANTSQMVLNMTKGDIGINLTEVSNDKEKKRNIVILPKLEKRKLPR